MKTFLILSSLFFMAFACKKDATPEQTEDKAEVVADSPTTEKDLPKTETNTQSPPVIQVTESSPSKEDLKDKVASESFNQDTAPAFKEGMTWEYKFVNYSDGKVKSTVNETHTITKIEGDIIYVNDLKKWKVNAGKVYELQPTRGGGTMESLKYFEPKGEKEEFQTLIGGDAITTATIYKMDKPVTTKAGAFENCLLLETGVDEKIYFSPSVGVVKKEIGVPGSKFYMVQELVDFKMK